MNFRFSLLIFLVICGATILGCSSSEKDGSYFQRNEGRIQRLAILQGATSRSETQIAVLVHRENRYRYILEDRRQGTPVKAARMQEHYRHFSDWGIQYLHYKGLNPADSYLFRVEEPSGKIVDQRRLSTLDPDLKKPKILIASCLDDTYDEVQKKAWSYILREQNPDAIFLLGDNVYADKRIGVYEGPADVETIWLRHVETRKQLFLFKSPKLIPIFATWDDHDYGVNDGDESFVHKKSAQRFFEAFFPMDQIEGALEPGPGVSRHFQAFGQDFFFMDDRYFRSSQSDGKHWGAEQEQWLWSRLKKSTSPAWILNGNQFFGGYHNAESFESDHPKNFRYVLSQLRKHPYPVLFVSGDRHFLEVSRIPSSHLGYPTFEITTSAIHAKVFPGLWKKSPNPNQIVGVDDKMNYVIVQPSVLNKNKELEISLEAFQSGGELLFRRRLNVLREASNRVN